MSRLSPAILIVAAVLIASQGQAAQTPAGAGFGGGGNGNNFPYAQIPTAQEFFRYYPERARKRGLEGHASINCLVLKGGSVNNCTLISESPTGFEFGDAAIKLAPLFKLKLADGAPTAGTRITIPITFRLAAPSPGDDAWFMTPSYWAKQPTAQDLENARPAGVSSGLAQLQCHVRQGFNVSPSDLGKLDDCKVIQTNGGNTGPAALKLASLFQMTVSLARVASSDSIVQFDVAWQPKR